MQHVGSGGARRVTVTVGFAAGDRGASVAYALVEGPARDRVLRVPFRCRPAPAMRGRDVAYAALIAVAQAVREHGVRRVVFAIADDRLRQDIAERLPVPTPLAIPYVTLRCALNRFADAAVVVANDGAARDLTARARAEASLHVAA